MQGIRLLLTIKMSRRKTFTTDHFDHPISSNATDFHRQLNQNIPDIPFPPFPRKQTAFSFKNPQNARVYRRYAG